MKEKMANYLKIMVSLIMSLSIIRLIMIGNLIGVILTLFVLFIAPISYEKFTIKNKKEEIGVKIK